MFQMIEVVGVSTVGFSEAIKEGVKQLTAAGKKPHFLTVVEQRGSIRDGEVKEFQAVIKVAVES